MKKPRIHYLRIAFMLFLCAALGIGLATTSGLGTASAWGWDSINAICPLGALEALIAFKGFPIPLLIGLGIIIILTIVFGKAFCSWGCPVPLIQKLFKPRKRAESHTDSQPLSCKGHRECSQASCPAKHESNGESRATDKSTTGFLADSRMWILCGALASTAIAGFPVFCLVCPIGLSFAFAIGIWHLFQYNETTWSLLVFPAILLIEIVFFKKWCTRICPISALTSLLSRANRTFRPTIMADRCRRTSRGETCNACTSACPLNIDLHNAAIDISKSNECTRCGKCFDTCPAHAISFPFLAFKKNAESPFSADATKETDREVKDRSLQ